MIFKSNVNQEIPQNTTGMDVSERKSLPDKVSRAAALMSRLHKLVIVCNLFIAPSVRPPHFI